MFLKILIKKIIPDEWLDAMKHIYCLLLIRKHSKYDEIEIKEYVDDVYLKTFGRHINWERPETYTEKINVSKLYEANSEKNMLSDKYRVREWVSRTIGSEYLIPIYGCYESFEEIDFDSLPDAFVIKCNHDSGSVTLIKNKKMLSKRAYRRLKKLYDRFYLKRNFAYLTFEMHYANIEPKILIEKYMGDNIKDYKFLCFNGKPEFCWVDFDRFSNHRRNIYDLEWNLQDFMLMPYMQYESECLKPENFDEMIEVATLLCKPFKHVRVDLYDIDGRVYFGEMTFTTDNGLKKIVPTEWDYKLGNMWI